MSKSVTMNRFYLLLACLAVALGLQAESLPLTGVNRYGEWKYPLIVNFTSQWSAFNLSANHFSAAEYYKYKVVFSEPIPSGLQLSIQNAAEASAYSGQYIPIAEGTTVVEAEFDLSKFTDEDIFVTNLRLQSMDNQAKTVYIESVSLFNEYDEEFPQTPKPESWNSASATDPNGPFSFSAPYSFWGMNFYSQLGPWENTLPEAGYVDKITLYAGEDLPANGFAFYYNYVGKKTDGTDTTLTAEVPVDSLVREFTFTIDRDYTNLYLRYIGSTSINFYIDSITRTTMFVPPLVYEVENTAAGDADPFFPSIDEAPTIEKLTDPFAWADGSGRVTEFKDWSKRRGEIAKEIQHYEIGTKPAVDLSNETAWMEGDSLFVDVTIGGDTLHMMATINYPEDGKAPYALMIGMNDDTGSLPVDLFKGKNIATMTFTSSQVNAYMQNTGQNRDSRVDYEFVKLYPDLIENGAYAEWPWGVSRLIDGLQILGTDVTQIDMKHIGVTGCSYAGKMALFCGAFDERIALTIAQEPGGGGAAAWRVSHQGNNTAAWSNTWQKAGGVESLDGTDENWFRKDFKTTYGADNVYKLPYDHHELVALICPRAVLMLGNTDYVWLADRSGYVSMNAARKVWEQFGIEDRIGYSIVGGHGHCSLPGEQYAEVNAFIDKFLLDDKTVNTDNITIAPDYEEEANPDPIIDYTQWIDWWGTGLSPYLPRPEYKWYYLQAENMADAVQGAQWTRHEDSTRQDGAYMQSPDMVFTTLPTDNAYILSGEFDIETLGDYYIYALISANGRTHDACWISFDNNTPSRVNGLNNDGEWGWANLSKRIDDGTRDAFVCTLNPGTHKVNIFAKETEFKIDAICISNNDTLPDKTPTDISIVESLDYKTRIIGATGNGSQIRIALEASEYTSCAISIYATDGRKLSTATDIMLHQGRNTVTVDTPLPAGAYIITIRTPNEAASQARILQVRPAST